MNILNNMDRLYLKKEVFMEMWSLSHIPYSNVYFNIISNLFIAPSRDLDTPRVMGMVFHIYD